MHGDFSRVTFDRRRHFSGVLAQQGMVTLDADQNEQAAIQLAQVRSAVRDLIGPHGTVAHAVNGAAASPVTDFAITRNPNAAWDFLIGPGRYWVAGVACELEAPADAYIPPSFGRVADKEPVTDAPDPDPTSYLHQPDYLEPPGLSANHRYLVYLEVSERHLTSLDDPAIREVALGGPDTAGRARVVWQVKALELASADVDAAGALTRPPEELLAERVPPRSGARLAARAWRAAVEDDECALAAEPRYRGPENHLYRVEIHQVSAAGATWKWSRDNGSVVYPIDGSPDGAVVTLEHLGRDDRTALKEGALLEPVDRRSMQADPAPLLVARSIDRYTREVTLAAADDSAELRLENARYLRRWDHAPVHGADGRGLHGALPPKIGAWLTVEDGVQVWFVAGAGQRPGDHWLIPARAVTGDVEWRRVGDAPLAIPPHGVRRWFAPLALISTGAAGVEDPGAAGDLRRILTQTLQ